MTAGRALLGRALPARARLAGAPVACAVLALLAGPAVHAEGWRLTPEIRATVTGTNNSGAQTNDLARSDMVLELQPRVRLLGQGGRVTVDGSFWVSAVAYARGTQPNRLLPEGDLSAKVTLVERWVRLDTRLQVQQSVLDPFAAQPGGATTVNRLTTTSAHIAPAIDHEFSPTLSLLARTDLGYTRRSGSYSATDPRRGFHSEESRVLLSQKTAPLGWELEASRDNTNFQEDATSVLSSQMVRGRLTWVPQPQVKVGLALGREVNRYAGFDRNGTTYGLRVDLAPTERTTLAMAADHRFFGLGWDIDLRHRSPFMVLSAHLVQRPSVGTAFQTLQAGSSTASLLDAMLTTRQPDAALRAQAVRDLMAQYNLPDQLQNPVDLFADTAQLERGLDLSAVFTGRLTTFTFNAFLRRNQTLQASDDPLAPDPADQQASRQVGWAVYLNRRLSPLTSADLVLSASQVRGLGAREGDVLKQRAASFSVSQRLAQITTLTAGLRRQLSDSTVTGVSSGETAGFVTLSHRF